MVGYGVIPLPWIENSAAISQAVSDFNSALGQGFVLDADAGKDLLRVIDEMIVTTQDILDRSYHYSQELKLGRTPAALVYRPYQVTVATDSLYGFLPSIKALNRELVNLSENIRSSIAHIHSTDSSVSESLPG